MTFDDFIIHAFAYASKHHEQRFGQACMNALRWCNNRVYKNVKSDIWEISNPQDTAILHWFEEVERLW